MKLFKHKSPKIGLALGSGAARGLAHIGVIKALKEASIPVNAIAGTSMGALVGACFAREGEIDTVEEIALNTDWRQLARLLDPKLRLLKKGLIRGQRVEELLYTLIGNIDFKDLKIPFAAIATDVNTGQQIVITKGSVVEAVRASISIPGIFIPVKSQGMFLVDGGLINPVPADILRDMGAKFIIAVNVLAELRRRKLSGLPEGDKSPDTPSIFDTLIQSIYIMEYEMIKAKMPNADVVIAPDTSCVESFEFHRGKEAILAGYEAARNALPDLQRLIHKR